MKYYTTVTRHTLCYCCTRNLMKIRFVVAHPTTTLSSMMEHTIYSPIWPILWGVWRVGTLMPMVIIGMSTVPPTWTPLFCDFDQTVCNHEHYRKTEWYKTHWKCCVLISLMIASSQVYTCIKSKPKDKTENHEGIKTVERVIFFIVRLSDCYHSS